MARTHSSYTASPARTRSPRRSAAQRSSSEDGSQYEMDLDALGLNSTFESTALEGSHEPPVDRVDSSEVEGPDDFTMNMTYWMTADLPPAHVKSRKEAKKTDSRPATSRERPTGEERSQQAPAALRSSTAASPTVRVDNGTTASRERSTPASERSMENDEKVRSFLSALPDANLDLDLDHLPAGTPLHGPHHSLLQVPRSSPPKARSLQPTVEDVDTPRKPTQQTVIHHPSPTARDDHDRAHDHDHDHRRSAPQDRVVQLQARLDQQELAARTRITELETILAYTRTELETARDDNYKHKDNIAGLQRLLEEQRVNQNAVNDSLESRLKAQHDAHKLELQEREEELQRDHALQLQTQHAEFQRQHKELEASRCAAGKEAETTCQTLENVQAQATQLKQSNDQHVQRMKDMQMTQEKRTEQDFATERSEMQSKLAAVQSHADTLQADLARATAEAKASREDPQALDTHNAATKSTTDHYLSRIAYLETHLQDAKFSLECAQADVAAKAQLFQTNIDLNTSLRTLRSELDTQRGAFDSLRLRRSSHLTSESQLHLELTAKEQLVVQHVAEKEVLEHQLSTAQGRISGLESSLAALRTQLADAHREIGSVRTDVERVSNELDDANDRLADARAEADRRVADIEKKLAKTKDLKLEAESKLRELMSQHDDLVEGHAAMLEKVRDKAEDAVRKTGALLTQERKEKARLKKDVERLQREMEQLRANEHGTDESDNTTQSHLVVGQLDDTNDKEIESLRTIIKNQIAETKTLNSSHASALTSLRTTHEAALTALRSEVSTLQQRLDIQARDHEAINAAMDEQLSHLLSKLMKERARTVVGKRDDQWEEVQKSAASEKELLGKMLLRQWGREECGIAEEKRGQKQLFEYKYAAKER
ncbi:uncharacterized protein EKO05_0009963 [Ascochyta rabiei]|uniref:uncharacterized protein n=1 Tax=Didymella rabiei TaxID=5454 RepID=UPI0018FF4F82|nr:uncharacterized protein EKO05_0009963 [Ascochyta rabiei]UPX19709.1 hypothetical protein EKO05_0009963 [Ascochyta rabiei]